MFLHRIRISHKEKIMIKQKLKELNIPSPLAVGGKKAETVEEWEKVRPLVAKMMQECEYGYIPAKPESFAVEIEECTDKKMWAGKATHLSLKIKSVINGEEFTFPATYIYPNKGDKFKTFVHINFRPDIPDRYMPTEEIIDNGFACLSFCYEDVTSDDGDFTNGLAGVIYKNSVRTVHSPGKIAMWAWAAMRAMDFLQTRDEVDKENICVCGHSRLGKTALLTAAMDERFAVAHSNCSGCSGDSLNRGKAEGNETIEDMLNRFWFWYCENYKSFAGKDNETPFDQHFLSALIAPRKLHIASAAEDVWAGPNLEFFFCAASSEVYELYGKKGFVYEDEDFLKTGKYLNEGTVGLCHREGKHFFSRTDWLGLMDFMNK